MRAILYFLCILIYILQPQICKAEKIIGHPEPLPHELLNNPINLEGCGLNVNIIEWRPSIGKDYTKPNDKAIKIMKATCKVALSMFEPYLKYKGYNFIVNENEFKVNISLIPWNAFDQSGRIWGPGDGDDYRNLQDTKYRFNKRPNSDTHFKEILGEFDRKSNIIFTINDTLDKDPNHEKFVSLFAHELFHAMTNNFKIVHRLSWLSSECFEKDEALADEFGELVYKAMN